MKNKLFQLVLASIAFASCQKEDNTLTPATSSGDGGAIRQSSTSYTAIGTVPTSFTKKALLENFTGTPYAKVPENDYTIMQLQNLYPNRIIAASFHKNDRMENLSASNLINFVSSGTSPNMPSVMVNRTVYNSKLINDYGTWANYVTSALSGTPAIGLAIESSLQNYTINMNIHVGFNTTVTGNYKMCVYIVENGIQHPGSGYDQSNGFNTTVTSPFYNLGDPIVNYTHNNVVRIQGTTMSGISIPSSYQITGGHMIQPIAIDFPAFMNASNSYIVAFVYNTSNLTIMNAQIAKVGTLKNWD